VDFSTGRKNLGIRKQDLGIAVGGIAFNSNIQSQGCIDQRVERENDLPVDGSTNECRLAVVFRSDFRFQLIDLLPVGELGKKEGAGSTGFILAQQKMKGVGAFVWGYAVFCRKGDDDARASPGRRNRAAVEGCGEVTRNTHFIFQAQRLPFEAHGSWIILASCR